MEYNSSSLVFRDFMDWEIANDFESIFKYIIFLLHFIQDIKLFKEYNPDKLFIYEAKKQPQLAAKVKRVISNGIISFLDYAIELKEKQPEVFQELLNDYLISTRLHIQKGKN